jgi:hypothetical protein
VFKGVFNNILEGVTFFDGCTSQLKIVIKIIYSLKFKIMTSEQENKRSMYMVSHGYLLKHAAVTALLPNYGDYFMQITNGIAEMDSIREAQELDKRGLALIKKQLKARLIALSTELSRKAVAYAKHTNDQEFLNEINYSESDLKKSADTILKDKCQIIYDRSNAFAVALLPYDVTAALFTDLQNTLTAYNSAIPKPRLGIAERKQATKHLALMIKKTDEAFNEIDILVEVVRNSQSEFYEGYQSVRMIVDNGQGKTAFKGKVIDSEFGYGLQGATIIFKMNEDNGNPESNFKEIVKKSAKKGGFLIKKIARGSYNLSVNKPGYEEGMYTVHVTDGVLCNFEAGLMRVKG